VPSRAAPRATISRICGILCGGDAFERTAEGAQVDTEQLIEQVAADGVVVEGRSPLESGQSGVGQDRVVGTHVVG
jgi:hypothetical protein